MSVRKRTRLIQFLFLLVVVGCARAPIRSSSEAMRPISGPDKFGFNDDLQFQNLADSIEADISRLKDLGSPGEPMRFGPRTVTRGEYVSALESLLPALKQDTTGAIFIGMIAQSFDVYEVYGGERWSDVLVSGYYEPVIKGALKKTATFTAPVYGVPKDMVLINTAEFNRAAAEGKNATETKKDPAFDEPTEHALDRASAVRLPDTNFRGRLIPSADGRLATVVPYYSRSELTASELPKNTVPILAWVDPIDAFFLQIQGSGQIDIGTKTPLRVGYAEQNGRPYVPIARALFDKIPREKMSRYKIVEYLHSLSSVEAMAIMNTNPSFVFFQKLDSRPITSFGTEVSPGRTIATDARYFPKGALAFLEFQKPVFLPGNTTNDEPSRFETVRRFVLDQDVGGGIRGPSRVDLFMGTGSDVEREAGVMRQRGRLYYLVPKAHEK